MEEKMKVYLIVESKHWGKVYARIFSSKEKAENAMNERDDETGERLYPEYCHIIEREVE